MIRRRTSGVSAVYTVEDEKKKEERVKRKEVIENAEKERKRLLRENYRSNRNAAVVISESIDIHEKSLPAAEQMSERLSSLHGYPRGLITSYPTVNEWAKNENVHSLYANINIHIDNAKWWEKQARQERKRYYSEREKNRILQAEREQEDTRALAEARIMRDIHQQRENAEWERRARREMDNANLREKNRRLQIEREDERVRLAKRQLSIHISDAKSSNSENGMFVRTGTKEPVSELKKETNRNKQEIILGMSIVGAILAIVAACIAFN